MKLEVEGQVIAAPRRFVMVRDRDRTGISGTGVIMEGVELSDGTVYAMWRTDTSSEIRHSCIDNLVRIHGHGGDTRLIWLDDVEGVVPSCSDHLERSHRDMRPPWCDRCGWTHGQPAVPAQQIARVA